MIVGDPACGMSIDVEKARFKTEFWGNMYHFCSENCMQRFLRGSRIAYFSMEIGIRNEIPTYSGGWGFLLEILYFRRRI